MTFFRFIWYSCAGFRTYRLFADLPARSAVIYWMLFSVLLTAVLVGNTLHLANLHLPDARRIAQTIPSLAISNGVAFSEAPQPSVLNSNQFPIIIDLTNSIPVPEKRFDNGMAIHRKDFRIWRNKLELVTMPLAFLPDGRVDSAYVDSLHRAMYRQLPSFCAATWLVFAMAGLFQAFLFTVLLNLLESAIEPRLSFRQLFNISVFAMTPGAVIAATYVSTGISDLFNLPMVCLCCYCLFLVLATGVCRVPKAPDGDDKDE